MSDPDQPRPLSYWLKYDQTAYALINAIGLGELDAAHRIVREETDLEDLCFALASFGVRSIEGMPLRIRHLQRNEYLRLAAYLAKREPPR